jgi:hypothetical protein
MLALDSGGQAEFAGTSDSDIKWKASSGYCGVFLECEGTEMSEKSDCIHQIGEVAGCVWQELAKVESTSISKLVKSVDAPRDVILQAIGWLARENKIEIVEKSRGRAISLTHAEHSGESMGADSREADAA